MAACEVPTLVVEEVDLADALGQADRATLIRDGVQGACVRGNTGWASPTVLCFTASQSTLTAHPRRVCMQQVQNASHAWLPKTVAKQV